MVIIKDIKNYETENENKILTETGIEKRKEEHLKLAISKEAKAEYNYFDDIIFVHNAVPKTDLDDVDIKVDFLNKKVNPLMITAITGGAKGTEEINKAFASVAEKYNLVLGLGSQRAMIEKPELKYTFYVRDVAPNALVFGNIGIAQILKYSLKQIVDMVNEIEADGLAIHLNILQEMLQPEGDRMFAGADQKIFEIAEEVPTIIKETGGGINNEVARKFKKSKIKAIDVSGYGGTSWAKIELMRRKIKGLNAEGDEAFKEWGLPTPVSVVETSSTGIFTIASGGVRNGLDAAKAFALGARMAGAANPFVEGFFKNKKDGVEEVAKIYLDQIKKAVFLTGCSRISDLDMSKIIVFGRLKEMLEYRGYLK